MPKIYPYIRSFVRREGKITNAQKRALTEILPAYELPQTLLELRQVFANNNPVHLEIGFGSGENLAFLAQENPDINFIGVEVYRPGIGSLLNRITQFDIKNIRISIEDAVIFIKTRLKENSIDKLMLFFPDPWHKKRHNKRRIVNLNFLSAAVRVIKPGGVLHIVTDWKDYAVHIKKLTMGLKELQELASPTLHRQQRAITRFERRARNLGHDVFEFLLTVDTNAKSRHHSGR